jgi:Leucine-rich repeat (LRR) protein
LKLNNNYLTQFPQLNGLSNLSQLVIHHNSINSLFNSSLIYPNLQSLDLSYNQIITIPNGFFTNTSSKLSSINLSNNRITSIEKGAFDNLTNLEVLRLSKNRISSIPKELFRKLILLKELDLSRNRLESLDGLVFHGLESLQYLKLRRNHLSQLFDGAFWGLISIQYLHLDHNNITKVRKGWLYGLSSLNQLTLSHNSIDEIDGDGFEFSRKLSELDLSYNRLHSITKDTFSRLHSLQYLTLDHNSISFIDDSAFRLLSALEVLELNYNEISWTIEDSSGSFVGLDRLKNLGLAFNYIKSIAKRAFSGLTNLEILDLTHNPITSIQDQSFSWFKRLQELRLNTTDLLCDCTLKWLPIWLKSWSAQHLMNESKCKHPKWLINKSLLEANPEEFTCQDYLKPYLIDDFKLFGDKPLTALKGDNMTLSCKAASSSPTPMQFQWRKDNQIMNTSIDRLFSETFANLKNGNLTEYTGNLHLTNIEDEDEGRYQCIASNNFGAVYTHKIRINVHVMPLFTKTPSNVTVKVGNTARLECAARGQPLPEISWQKDGGDNFPAAMERRMHVMPTDDVFFIVEVKLKDMGLYTCTATNDAGSITANAYLNVLETPTFVRPMSDKEAIAGETAVLECMASGSPKPTLTWSKDGGAIIATERHFFTADNQLLIIVKTKPTDNGQYMCEMSNILGTAKDSTYLNIIPSVNSNDNEKVEESSGFSSLFLEDSKTIGIIIIAVFVCIVFTSFVWVIIIYHTRKRSDDYSQTNTDETNIPEFDSVNGITAKLRSSAQKEMISNIFEPTNSDDMISTHSDSSTKDSGTGDSARRDSRDVIHEQEIDFNEQQIQTHFYPSYNSAQFKTKSGLYKGLSMDHISVKRSRKRPDSQSPNIVINPWTFSPIKSFSVNDMFAVDVKQN